MSNNKSEHKPVVKGTEDMTVYRIAQFMQKFNVGCVVITRNGDPVGIVTDRDLALAIGTSGFDPRELTASEIMQTPIETVGEGTGLLELVSTMAQSDVRRLPVVKDGELVDIVTMDDLIGRIHEVVTHMNSVIEAESPQNIQ